MSTPRLGQVHLWRDWLWLQLPVLRRMTVALLAIGLLMLTALVLARAPARVGRMENRWTGKVAIFDLTPTITR